MNFIQKLFARSRIPEGFYCYTYEKDQYVPCPFYSKIKERPEQENGYCSYLGKGDWNINESYPPLMEIIRMRKDRTSEKVMVPKETLLPLSLLWDGCKECGVKFIEDKNERK